MCYAGVATMFGADLYERANPGERLGFLVNHPNLRNPLNGPNNSVGVPYRYGQGFDISTTPSEKLGSNPVGIAEKNRRKSLTPDQYGRGLWGKDDPTLSSTKEDAPPPVLRNNISTGSSNLRINKRKDRANKRNVASGRRTSKAKRFST